MLAETLVLINSQNHQNDGATVSDKHKGLEMHRMQQDSSDDTMRRTHKGQHRPTPCDVTTRPCTHALILYTHSYTQHTHSTQPAYTHRHTHGYGYTPTYTPCIYSHIHTYTGRQTFIHVDIHTYIHIDIHTHIHILSRTHTHTHIHIHTHTERACWPLF